MNKQIIICADDFAQNSEISEGIILLARNKRISAVSCMVNSACWDEMSQELNDFSFNGYIGLHLNLTFGQPLSSAWRKFEGETFYPLSVLLKKLYLGHIKSSTIEAEIQAQLDVFSNGMHIYPDFIDGHQHVHQYKIVREALFDVHNKVMGHINSSEEDEFCYIDSFFRNTSNGYKDLFRLLGFPKRQILNFLGGIKLKKMLILNQTPTNSSFSGIYNFKYAHNYRKYFKKFLSESENGGIIMCHPGNYSNDSNDPLHQYRHYELDYLNSDLFLTDIEDNYFTLIFKK